MPCKMNIGVFLQLLFTCNANKMIPTCGKSIILVFSKRLLQHRSDYHVTNEWVGGVKYEPLGPFSKKSFTTGEQVHSFDKSTLSELFQLDVCSGSFKKNEIVFENDVPLDDLMEIWICDQPSLNGLDNKLDDEGKIIRIPRKNHVFYPKQMKIYVENLLKKYNMDIPVRLIQTEPELPDPCIYEGKKSKKVKKVKKSKKSKNKK